MGIFATPAIEMSVPNWASFRFGCSSNYLFLKTNKKVVTVRFSLDAMAVVKVFLVHCWPATESRNWPWQHPVDELLCYPT
jgi:hypothetical protein